MCSHTGIPCRRHRIEHPTPSQYNQTRADLSLCYPLMRNIRLEATTTHFNVLGKTRSICGHYSSNSIQFCKFGFYFVRGRKGRHTRIFTFSFYYNLNLITNCVLFKILKTHNLIWKKLVYPIKSIQSHRKCKGYGKKIGHKNQKQTYNFFWPCIDLVYIKLTILQKLRGSLPHRK